MMCDKNCENCGQIDRPIYNPGHYICPIKGRAIRDIDTDEMDACTFFITKREAESIRKKIDDSRQKSAYKYCDNMCGIPPIKCGSLYGDYNKCPKLIKMFTNMIEESDRMHGV